MDKKFSAKKAICLGILATCTYKLIRGEGIFNKPRFYEQYKACQGYLNTYHIGAEFGHIVKNDTGWHCIVNTDTKSFMLNISKTDEGVYLFSETEL